MSSGKKKAYGGVVVNERGEVLLREPKGLYGGYAWTWPKGGSDPGETPEATALRETLEETGIEAVLGRPVPGDFEGDTSITRLWLMRVGKVIGPPDPKETVSIRWVTFDEASKLIQLTPNLDGRKRDLQILAAAKAMLEES